MPIPTQDPLAEALAEVIQQKLTQGEPVHIPGLGTFRVEHQPSQLEEQPDGEFIIMPPSDKIVFLPES